MIKEIRHYLKVIDKNTGDVVEGARVFSDEELKRSMELYGDEYLANLQSDEIGQCIAYIIKDESCLTKLLPQTIARLFYLSTYMHNEDGILRDDDNRILSKAKMLYILGLQRKSFDSFFAEVTDAGYLVKDDRGCFHIAGGEFYEGKLPKNNRKPFTKIYVDTMQYLYRITPQSKHRYLGYIFMMLPFVNKKYNIICSNPKETTLELIEPMTVGDFCDKVGYGRSNASRLIRAYKDIVFEYGKIQQQFCSFVADPDKTKASIFCNPHVFYSGADLPDVEKLGMFCAYRNEKGIVNRKPTM